MCRLAQKINEMGAELTHKYNSSKRKLKIQYFRYRIGIFSVLRA